MCRLVTDFWLIVAVGAGMSHGYTVEINGTDRQTGGLMCACSICPNLTCFTDGACMSQIVRERRILARHDSCLSRADMFPKNHPAPYLCSSHEKTWETNIITCCNERDYCNLQNITSSASNALPVWLRSTTTTVATTTAMVGMSLDQRNAFIGIGAFLVFLIVLITLLTAILYRRSKTLKRQMRNAKEQARLLEEGQQTNGMLNAMMSEMTTTGSGSGLPLLVQLTVARQVTLVRAVGKGRFGEVFLGKWQGENVAVKIFRSHDEESWKREVEIYHTVMLRHENLLGFIAADNKDCGLTTQLWLITEYHEQGSLYDYLTRTTVDVPGVLRLCFSIANGLSHLHMEILGISALQITKPAIAHRDLKSKNILVKRNGQCVIADLGLAVAYVGVQGIVDVPPTGKVGTVRYLAPEVLDGTFRNRAFENYKAVDVYALALVIWEICSRLQFYGNTVQPYELPYSSDVRGDPDINQMREVVVTQKKRPSVANQWTTSQPMSSMCRIMKECWYANPHSRLTSLRVKKTIAQLIADEDVKL